MVYSNYIILSTPTHLQADVLKRTLVIELVPIQFYLKGSLSEEWAQLFYTILESKTVGIHHSEVEFSSK